MSMTWAEVGEVVRQVRLGYELTQQELVQLAGVGITALQKLERGVGGRSNKTLNRIERWVDVPLGTIKHAVEGDPLSAARLDPDFLLGRDMRRFQKALDDQVQEQVELNEALQREIDEAHMLGEALKDGLGDRQSGVAAASGNPAAARATATADVAGVRQDAVLSLLNDLKAGQERSEQTQQEILKALRRLGGDDGEPVEDAEGDT